MKKLVLMMEGQGDREAGPILVRRILTESALWGSFGLVQKAILVGEAASLTGSDKNRADWLRLVQIAGRESEGGGVLALLDGDCNAIEGEEFTACAVAAKLALRAAAVGAGAMFSLAVVFARQEYESWLLAGVESLAGRTGPDLRSSVRPGALPPAGDLEVAPRNAKGALGALMTSGYKATRDQKELTKLVGLQAVRDRGMRSFTRLENAMRQLAESFAAERFVSTPAEPANRQE